MKKISIITINYNNYEGLVKTAESVINQTFKDIEYIIIDGGSTDGGKEYIESISQNLEYWVSEPDKGIFNAMNKGIEKATGDYLLFLNSSDCLNGENALNDFINHENFKGDIIYGNLKFEKGGMQFSDYLTPFFFVRSSLPHQASLIKKTVFESIGLYDESYKIAADSKFFMKSFICNQFSFNYIPFNLTLFDTTGVSNNESFNKLKREERDRYIKENLGIYYEDYIKMEEQRVQIIHFELNTFKGVIRRISNKLKKIIQ